MEKSESHSGKRSLHEIINQVYEFLKGKGEVHQSILRDVVPSPSNKHILELIKNIQDRPYSPFPRKREVYLSRIRIQSSSRKIRANQISTLVDRIKNKYLQLHETDSDFQHFATVSITRI